jgi:cobalt-zinc-cadmium efflux system outer membrane protein
VSARRSGYIASVPWGHRTPRSRAGRARRSLGLLVCCGASAAAAVPQDAPPPQRLELAQALELARAHDPRLVAARLRRPVDLANVALAGERPNPEARYEHTNELPHDLVSLAQPLELGGKRERRITAARAAVLTGEAELAQAEERAEVDAQRAYYAAASAQRREAIARELRDLAARSRQIAYEREQAGEVSRLEVLQADLARDAADNEASALQGELAASRAELNLRIGRPPGTATEVSEDLEPIPPADARLSARNAALTLLERRIAEAEARLEVARAQRTPDLTLEGTLSHGARPEFTWGYHAAVAVVIPLFTRHEAGVQLEQAALDQLRAQRAALEGQVAAGAFAARARAEAARTAFERYRDEILPTSREVERMAEESYRAGQTGLPALLEALRAARELRQRQLQVASDYESALAALHEALRVGPTP